MKKWIPFIGLALAIVCFAQEPATTLPTVKVAANETFNLTSSSQTIPLTTLFTPAAAGAYRVSVYVDATPSGSGSAMPTIYWTDDFNSITFNMNTSWGSGGPAQAGEQSVIIHSAESEPIQISFDTYPSEATAENIYVTVEKLP